MRSGAGPIASGLFALAVLACDGGEAADPDAGAPAADAAEAIDAAPPPPDADPSLLSSRGLYDDIAAQDFADDLLPFAPRHVLWSDAAAKQRFLRLPPGARIDSSDMAHWRLPVGAQLWKEFRSPGGVLLETRLIERLDDDGGDDDFFMGAFVWNLEGTEAVLAPDGAVDVNGTGHDVPAQKRCRTCHQGEPGKALGVSALQLAGAGPPGLRLDDLVAADLLTVAPPPGASYGVPGDAVTEAALGYLHANCGHCHNSRGIAWPDVPMTLQLGPEHATPEETPAWVDLVGVPLTRFMHPGLSLRVAPGDPAASAIVYRMSIRGTMDEMPPLATELVDADGVALVSAWIEAL